MDAAPHIIESTLILIAAFLAGCVIGYLLRRGTARLQAKKSNLH